jgi:hypothetical protein
MTLQERLEAAKAERRRRAGLPAEAPEVSPMHQPIGSSSSSDLTESSSLDLTGSAPVVDLRPEVPPPATSPSFNGAMTVADGPLCPNCGCEGRIDMQDVVGGVDHLTCTNCALLYQVAR